MSALLILICGLWYGQPHVVNYGEPTGNLTPGEVLVERGVPTLAACDQAGGLSITVDGVIWCLDEDY